MYLVSQWVLILLFMFSLFIFMKKILLFMEAWGNCFHCQMLEENVVDVIGVGEEWIFLVAGKYSHLGSGYLSSFICLLSHSTFR